MSRHLFSMQILAHHYSLKSLDQNVKNEHAEAHFSGGERPVTNEFVSG
jgi:hypothetical protein